MRKSYVTFKYCSNLCLPQYNLPKYHVNKLVLFRNSKHNFCTAIAATANNEIIEIVKELQKMLSCEFAMAKRICDEFPSITIPSNITGVKDNVKLLQAYHVTVQSIIENPFVLVLPSRKTIFVYIFTCI